MATTARTRWGVLSILVVGAILGVAAVAATTEMVHWSSTNEFCTEACHSMQWVGRAYQKGAHAKTRVGVTAGCGDCHIPYESQHANPLQYVVLMAYKAKSGAKDVYHQAKGTIDTEQKWLQERERLSTHVKTWMASNNSLTCRGCHDLAKMSNPDKPAAAEMHAPLVKAEGVVCVECHTNAGHVYESTKSAATATTGSR
jgi:nitrate/TMAO reductase-like tetraheme cytochrome c subunit